MRIVFIVLFAGVALVAVPTLANRGPSAEEVAAIAKVLTAEGITSWGGIERAGSTWLVNDVRDPDDGEVYDLKLSQHGYGTVARLQD